MLGNYSNFWEVSVTSWICNFMQQDAPKSIQIICSTWCTVRGVHVSTESRMPAWQHDVLHTMCYGGGGHKNLHWLKLGNDVCRGWKKTMLAVGRKLKINSGLWSRNHFVDPSIHHNLLPSSFCVAKNNVFQLPPLLLADKSHWVTLLLEVLVS